MFIILDYTIYFLTNCWNWNEWLELTYGSVD